MLEILLKTIKLLKVEHIENPKILAFTISNLTAIEEKLFFHRRVSPPNVKNSSPDFLRHLAGIHSKRENFQAT